MKKMITIGAVIAASLLIASSALAAAGGSPQSFNTTNYAAYSATPGWTAWPTNTQGTNATPVSTGGPVYIGYAEHVGINIQGFANCATGSAKIGVILITSMAGGAPTVTTGTNAYSSVTSTVTQNDWQTANSIGPIMFTLPAAAGTNWVNFQTNLPVTTLVGDANWIGVYYITNTLSSGDFITNMNITVNTKLLPRPLSP